MGHIKYASVLWVAINANIVTLLPPINRIVILTKTSILPEREIYAVRWRYLSRAQNESLDVPTTMCNKFGTARPIPKGPI